MGLHSQTSLGQVLAAPQGGRACLPAETDADEGLLRKRRRHGGPQPGGPARASVPLAVTLGDSPTGPPPGHTGNGKALCKL